MIRPVKEVADEAFKKLADYQSGKSKPVKTGREWLDSIFGGLLPQDIVTIAGASGGGKSFELQRIKNYVMNKDNNANADQYVWLDNSLEMRLLSNIIRDLHKNLEISKKKILTMPFTPSEQSLANNYAKQIMDGRFFIDEEATTSEEFEKRTRAFLKLHVDKTAVFITIDHIALAKNGGSDKKGAVDGIVEVINRLKKEFPNAIWIVLSQLNRTILNRIKDNDIMAMPNRADVFQSDTMYHISDYLYVTHNPYRLGINEFSRVNAKQYDYLEEHFTEPDKKGKVSFKTLAKMFFIVLKSRESDVIFDDIFIEDIDLPNIEKYIDKQDSIMGEIEEPDFEEDVPF
jgi:replicative DNA helicase